MLILRTQIMKIIRNIELMNRPLMIRQLTYMAVNLNLCLPEDIMSFLISLMRKCENSKNEIISKHQRSLWVHHLIAFNTIGKTVSSDAKVNKFSSIMKYLHVKWDKYIYLFLKGLTAYSMCTPKTYGWHPHQQPIRFTKLKASIPGFKFKHSCVSDVVVRPAMFSMWIIRRCSPSG